jgi:hypothetical protein
VIEDPSDLSVAARAQIERAIADAELDFIAAEDPGPQILILGRVPDANFRGMPPARDPIHFVLRVFEKVVQALCSETTWSADRLRVEADRWLDQLITRTFVQKSKGFAIDQFTTRVHHELSTRPFWLTLQNTIRERSLQMAVTVPTPPLSPISESGRTTDQRVPFSIRETAERLAVHEDRIRRMGERGEIQNHQRWKGEACPAR